VTLLYCFADVVYLTATDVYIRQILLFPQRIQNMSFIFIVVLRTWKSLTPKDVTAVKRLNIHIGMRRIEFGLN
jgi:hypothetical protein